MGHTGVPRECVAALWKDHCSTDYWRELWQENRAKYQGLTFEEVSQDINKVRSYRCWPRESSREACIFCGVWLDWTTTLLQSGFLQERSGTSTIGDEEFVDAVEASRNGCPLMHVVMRLLLQRLPEVVSNRSRRMAIRRRLHVGVPTETMRDTILTKSAWLLIASQGIFSALRAISEAPLTRELWSRGLDGVDDCLKTGFNRRECRFRNTGGGVAANESLLEAFYEQRDPGLDDAFARRLAQASDSPLLQASGLLAMADRKRNLGQDYSKELEAGFQTLRTILGATRLETLLPQQGPPLHLVWHYLDKLTLPLQVAIEVGAPLSLQGSVSGSQKRRAPQSSEVQMSVLPDRDLISDHIRRTREFHCPNTFKELIAALANGRDEGEGQSADVLKLVEVGGFLGDCILWALAWLGPHQILALEVEPVAAAMARFRESLVRWGVEDRVEIVTEPLGDGGSAEISMTRGASGMTPANPNFHLVLRQPLVPGTASLGALRAGSAVQIRPRALDEVLMAWAALGSPAEEEQKSVSGGSSSSTASAAALGSVDLVRIKAAGSEALIVAGLRDHLEARRVRCLMVEAAPPNMRVVQDFMAQLPWYSLDPAYSFNPRRPTLVYWLASQLA